MSGERKKVQQKPIPKIEPKKRVQDSVADVKKTEPKKEEKPEVKPKKSEDKYVRVALDAKADERNEFTTRVKNGELKYAYYATDNDKGYHYYLVLKK
jgi:hypothetical protein